MRNWLFLIVIFFISCEDALLEPSDIGVTGEIDLDITVNSDKVPDNLIVWYPFNGNTNDESGNELNSTVYEAELDVDRHGEIDSSYSFSTYDSPSWGERDDIMVTEYNELMNVESFTLFAWIRWEEKPNPYKTRPSTIMSRQDGDGLYNIFRFKIYNGGELLLQLGEEGVTSGYKVNRDEWTHVAVSYDEGIVKFYVNSILVNLISTDLEISTQPSHLTIGETWLANGYWYHFNGDLDDVGISNGSLTECEIRNLYEL